MTASLAAPLARLGFRAEEIIRRMALFDQADRAADRLGLAAEGGGVRRYHVPGRIEVLGKHTDYAGGRSLVCATEQGVAFLARPRSDLRIRILDARRDEVREFPIDPGAESPRGDWANYPITVAARLARDFGLRVEGLDLVFASDIPFAAGVSSSSALVVGVAWAMIDAGRLDQHEAFRANVAGLVDLGGYLGAMENGRVFRGFSGGGGVGTMGGSQDQTAILCAEADHLVQFRFDPVESEGAVRWPSDRVFAVAASGVVAEKTGAALEHYNDLARMTVALGDVVAGHRGDHATLGRLLIEGSGDLSGPMARLDQIADKAWADRLRRRLSQLAAECRIYIPGMRLALEGRDFTSVGALAARSQQGADEGLGNQLDETRCLVAMARRHGAEAASAFGAGFGGSVWAMVPKAGAADFLSRWEAGYRTVYPQHAGAVFFATRPAPPLVAVAGRSPASVFGPAAGR
jgi:galactokinase